jgi:hypothetical protein
MKVATIFAALLASASAFAPPHFATRAVGKPAPKAVAKKAAPVKPVAKKAAPVKAVAKKAAPVKAVAKKAAPVKAVAKKAAPVKAAPKPVAKKVVLKTSKPVSPVRILLHCHQPLEEN